MSDATLRMKSRSETPSGGWQFFQPETRWQAPFTTHDTFDICVTKIIAHRMGNARFNLPTEREAVALELENFTAHVLSKRGLANQYVVGAEKKTVNPEASITQRAIGAVAALVAEVRKDTNGARSLSEWIGEGAHPVPEDQANARSEVCLKCPMNKGRSGRIKDTVAAAIAEYSRVKTKIGLHVRDEGALKTCAACDCPLKLKVWVPLKHILSHTNVGIFPDNCWVVKENRNPPTPSEPIPPEKPTVTIKRWGAFGDVITATALASRLHAHGVRVRFATDKAIMPVLAGHPHIAEVVEHGSATADINLDGVYETHPERKQRPILSLFEEAARKQVSKPEIVLGTNGHFRPRLFVTDEEKKPFNSLFSSFKKPWVVIVPKSGKWKNRSIPDETWTKVAATVNGTCFWVGYDRIGEPIIDLGTRDFRKVMAAIACADLVVTVDTGPMHVAAALDKPILAIQQAFDLALRLPKDAKWTSFEPDLTCLKCGEFECPISKNDPPCIHVDANRLGDSINSFWRDLSGDQMEKKVSVAIGVPGAPHLDRSKIEIPRTARAADYISVVVTVFKRHKHLESAIKSARDAGFTGEIIVTAGGITPELNAELLKVELEGIKVIRNPEGSTNNEEWIEGCKAATKRFVILFHDDDLMLPGYADKLFPLISGEADFSICDAKGHGAKHAGPCGFMLTKSGVVNSRAVEDVLMRIERTASPVNGCFPKSSIISALEEWQRLYSNDKRFEAWPGFQVGNDLYLWLKASSTLKRCLVIREPGVSFNHHEGSATAGNIASGTRQFEKMYDTVRKLHSPRGPVRYGALCYVHDWTKAQGLLRNLASTSSTDSVNFFTDAPAPIHLRCTQVPKIGPLTMSQNVKDTAAFIAFMRGIDLAKKMGMEWFFWLETDCRVSGVNWLYQLWQENMSWPWNHVCSGTPVVWNLPMNGIDQAKTWIPYFADYTAATGRFPTLEGWRYGPQSAYPNGALAFYHTNTMISWFQDGMRLTGTALESWCNQNTAFDFFIGRKVVNNYGLDAPKMSAWLPSAYSGCGDHYYTASDRRNMLGNGVVAYHQEKDHTR